MRLHITEETKGIFGDDIKKVEVTFLYDYDYFIGSRTAGGNT